MVLNHGGMGQYESMGCLLLGQKAKNVEMMLMIRWCINYINSIKSLIY